MKLFPTMSRSALLLQCSYPFSVPGGFTRELPDPEPTSDAASYGLDFHAAMDRKKTRAKKKIGKGVLEHAKAAGAVLTRWLEREGWAGHPQIREASFALRPGQWKGPWPIAARCDPPTEDTHEYLNQQADEICGTADLITARKNELLVLDYKTGADDAGEFPYPSRMAQLRSLGLAAGMHLGAKKVQLAVLHAPPDGTPIVYADPPEDAKDEAHADALNRAMQRREDGTMRVGPECKYCPARSICPTRGSSLLDTADQLFGALAVRQSQALLQGNDQETESGIEPWDARLGRLYELTKLAEQTAKEIRVRLAEERRKGHLPVLADGRVLDFQKRTYRNLSMTGLKRMIGAKAAEREVKRLEKMGAIEIVEREELRPVND